MNRATLITQIKRKKTFLCVGLDPDYSKMPAHILQTEDPIFEFNKAIIDATAPYCVAYKPNTAFYEAHGVKGWMALEKTIQYIPKDTFIIADAKRGDIGNTSTQYAKAFFENMACDAITIAPYMGEDSVKPFIGYPDKWAIILGLTSNIGSNDFQKTKMAHGDFLFEEVIKKTSQWGSADNLMYVIGATQASYLQDIRKMIPDHFLLIPGVGAQGGSLEEVIKYGKNKDGGLLINSSREILYASQGEDFALAAGNKAAAISQAMASYFE